MNSLMSTKMFNALNKVYKISDVLGSKSLDITKYTVDYEYYDYLINIFKGYRYPLAKKIIANLQKGAIKPLMFEVPKNPKDKVFALPVAIFSFMKPIGKNLISFSDVSGRGSYVRDKTTAEIEHFKIYERDFYAYMQAAMVNREFAINGNKFIYNAKFINTVTESFAFMLSKVIDSVYPVSANSSGMDILQFLCAVYFLQNMFNFNREKAIKQALTLRSITKDVVINNCKYYSNDSEKYDMVIKDMTIDGKKTKVYPIDILLMIISDEFPFIHQKSVSYRSIVDKFTSLYGQNSVLAIEHFFSFVCMLQMSSLKIGMFKDGRIDSISKKSIDELEKIMVTII